MVDEETENRRAEVLAQLKEGSEYLENQKGALGRLWGGFYGEVVTFYEAGPIKKVRRYHTEIPALFPPYMKKRAYSRLTVIVGARITRTGRKRSPNGEAIVRSALFAKGISLSGLF